MVTVDPAQLTLKPMRLDDIPRVLEVEVQVYSHPWTQGIFADCMGTGYESWVVLYGDRYIGHGVLSVAAGESHLLNLSICKDYQRQGLGRWLLHHLLDQARTRGAAETFLEVRVSNQAAFELYLEEGFSEVGYRPGYYPNGREREDARVMACSL